MWHRHNTTNTPSHQNVRCRKTHAQSKHTIKATTIYSVFMSHDIMRLLDELQYPGSMFAYTLPVNACDGSWRRKKHYYTFEYLFRITNTCWKMLPKRKWMIFDFIFSFYCVSRIYSYLFMSEKNLWALCLWNEFRITHFIATNVVYEDFDKGHEMKCSRTERRNAVCLHSNAVWNKPRTQTWSTWLPWMERKNKQTFKLPNRLQNSFSSEDVFILHVHEPTLT